MNNKIKIKEIVLDSLRNLGEEEMIDSFINADENTKIRETVDSMALVVLSVDIEEKYSEVFDKDVKVLNDQDASFLMNFEGFGQFLFHLLFLSLVSWPIFNQ